MTTLSFDQVEQIVQAQHPDPFEVLGPHRVENNGQSTWVVRSFQPYAKAVTLILPGEQKEISLQPTHHPHFFEATISPDLYADSTLQTYKLRLDLGDREQVILDPYAFRETQFTETDLHLFGEGNHHRIYDKMGAHYLEIGGVSGVYFAVWAPSARTVSLLGNFNNWDGRPHAMRRLQTGGIWDLFVPGLEVGDAYKFEIKNHHGHIYEKSDPYGFQQEVRPKTASIVTDLDSYQWKDDAWMTQRKNQDPLAQPVSVYECHLGSWMHASAEQPALLPDGTPEPAVIVSEYKPGARYLTYREMADQLIPYVKQMGFTHIEVLPVAEHPFDGSWGYQVIGHYACTSRFGSPQDFMYFVDQCHANGIGVIVDWVPGHFPKDGHGLAFFDGSHLYEHADPRKGEHKEWGTLVFNYSRNEVRNYLVANALFWFEKYHIDGIRVDAVASMLYLDYCRQPGEWLPNEYGGRENIQAADFLRQMNHLLFTYYPGVLSIAEESTSWPMVSWPTYVGGLGFNLKWNMGWMHDMLDYFHMDPWFRQFHQNNLTFSMWYNHSENFMLALSHDEVVHGKSNMIGKMPGDEWQKFANLRCLYAYMFAHPGKKTLFMSMEFGQWSEWNVWGDLEWQLLQYKPHQELKHFLTQLNGLYKEEPALYTRDFEEPGFEWIDCSDNRHSVLVFLRRAKDSDEFVVAVCNFTPQPHAHYRIGVPEKGFYQELFNSDSKEFGGSNLGNLGGKWTDDWAYHHRSYSLDLCLPPLATLMFKLDRVKTAAALQAADDGMGA
jgi:1,4-alpha-glucan branching enzyme